MQCDDLVTHDVVISDKIGKGYAPRKVGGNQVVCGPFAGIAARFPGLGGNLGPQQAGWVDGTAVTVAGRDVLLNGTSVGAGPSVPLHSDIAARLDSRVGAVALALLVADNGRSLEGIGGYEAVVEVVGLPANSCGNGVLVLEGSVPALVFLAVDDDLFNVTVGCHKGRKKEEEREHDNGVLKWETKTIVSNNPEKRV